MTFSSTSAFARLTFWLKSLRVTTALTPGSASALDASILTIRACACGERRTAPISMPGALMSAPNWARPVTLSMPSGRSGRVPTAVKTRWSLSYSSRAMRQAPSI